MASSSPLLPRALLAGLALAGTLAIGACGGSSTSTVTSTSSATAPSAGTTSTGQKTTASALHQAFDTALRKNLVQVHHLSQAHATCVIKRLDRTLSDAEIAKASQGKAPASVRKTSRKAGAACALKHP